ncbi:MAG: DUF4255 domain-containing protein [Lachnospiraceae bacterium]|nr:DUF4255 domain-containing protein [Lachnospiraceae bacterium]
MSKYLVEDLQKALVPQVINAPEAIGLCSPDDHGDLRLGLFLYDVSKSTDIKPNGMVSIDSRTLGYEPIYLSLSYMITAYTTGDLRYKAYEEEKIIGAVIQHFNDYPVIARDSFDNDSPSSVDMRIELMTPDIDERFRVWSFPNTGYRLSLFYRVVPIVIDSARKREVARVTDASFNVGYSTRRGR